MRYNAVHRDDPGAHGRSAQVRSLVWSVVIVVVFVAASAAPVQRCCRWLTDPDSARLLASDHGREGQTAPAERDERTGRGAAAQRMQRQQEWVDQQLRIAMERGDFDNLPGAGKPIKDLGAQHDPDWWIKRLIEREKITGVLPPALQLRKDDAELDAKLDRHTAESEVRRELEEFNARVMKARYTPSTARRWSPCPVTSTPRSRAGGSGCANVARRRATSPPYAARKRRRRRPPASGGGAAEGLLVRPLPSLVRGCYP